MVSSILNIIRANSMDVAVKNKIDTLPKAYGQKWLSSTLHHKPIKAIIYVYIVQHVNNMI